MSVLDLLSPWFWLALAVLFSIVELASSFSLTTIWFAISSLVMVFVSGVTAFLPGPVRLKLYIALFLVLSGVLLVFTRPIAVKKLKVWRTKTNVDALVGRDAFVVKEITKFAKGEVKTGGQIWSARTEHEGDLKEGTECVIVGIEGVTAIVREKQTSKEEE